MSFFVVRYEQILKILIRVALALSLCTSVSACTGSHYLVSREHRLNREKEPVEGFRRVPSQATEACNEIAPPQPPLSVSADARTLEGTEPHHSAGDILRVDVTDGAQFGGTFAVNMGGRLTLPFIPPIVVTGLTARSIAKAIRGHLIAGGFFNQDVRVSVLPVRWSPLQVSVAGAVYLPGRSVINENDDKNGADTLVRIGDSPTGRFLDAGIRGGAGVRADADVTAVALIRAGRTHTIDMSGVFTGGPVPQIPLMAGDRIEVPSRGCIQPALFRPSQLTPAGIRVFMSNLTVPAQSNSNSYIEKYATSVPYGTRLLEGAVSANCVGGTRLTNAERYVVLVSRNQLTGRTDVIERQIEVLFDHPDDISINPYLIPNDAIACYDSDVTNLRDVASAIGQVLTTVRLGTGIF